MDTYLRDFPAKIAVSLVDVNDTATDATGNVIATITSATTTLPITGSPFTATHGTTGQYSVTIPAAALATLDTYNVVWTATVSGNALTVRDSFELVGGFLFTIAELRAFDAVLADTSRYPNDLVIAARNAAEERLERECGVSFRPRARLAKVDGTATTTILLPDLFPTLIRSASILAQSTTTVLTGDELADLVVWDSGVLERRTMGIWDWGSRNVTVAYEYGMTDAPEPVRQAAKVLARSGLVRSPVNDRATSESTDVGTIRYSIAGRDGPTGFPDVDAVITQFGRRLPALG